MPRTGPKHGGIILTITGRNLAPTPDEVESVRVGGRVCADVRASGTPVQQIRVILPRWEAMAAESLDVDPEGNGEGEGDGSGGDGEVGTTTTAAVDLPPRPEFNVDVVVVLTGGGRKVVADFEYLDSEKYVNSILDFFTSGDQYNQVRCFGGCWMRWSRQVVALSFVAGAFGLRIAVGI